MPNCPIMKADIRVQKTFFLGYPSTKDYITYVKDNSIPNCPIMNTDILCAEDIFVKI